MLAHRFAGCKRRLRKDRSQHTLPAGMNVLLLAPQPFFRVRGTPINVRNMVTTLVEAGHRVDLLCFPWGANIEAEGLRIIRCGAWPVVREVGVGLSLAKAWVDFRMFFRALALCAMNRYDVIHAVEESAFFAWLLARLFKALFIYDVDSCISEQMAESSKAIFRALAPVAVRLEKCAIRTAFFTLTVCQSLSDWARRLVPDARIVQIEDAPLQPSFQEDLEGSARLRESLKLGGAPVVVYTGNLAAYQGVDLLIRAMAIVRRRGADVRAVIVGGEPDEIERLREMARSLDLEGLVVFCGKRPLEEMPAYMSLASVLVSPRIKGENTALKIYTYMQSGKPIVATRLATHTQVLDDQCAILVRPTPDDLAAGLLRAIEEPLWAAALGREAQARVSARYSLASFRHKLRTAYSELARTSL